MGDITEPIRPKRPLQSADTGMENLKDSSIRWQYDFFFFFCYCTDKHIFLFSF